MRIASQGLIGATVVFGVFLTLPLPCPGQQSKRRPPVFTRRKLPPKPVISEGFYLPTSAIYVKNGSLFQEQWNTSFAEEKIEKEELAQHTPDEKCDRGLPFSATWQFYGPYAKPATSKTGVEGIFPHLINQMLQVCCNSTVRVSRGKISDTVRETEGELDSPLRAYDLTFPVTGTSLEDEYFKDMPFIPLVQAPRVALLVGANPEQVKTTQLLKTVFKAWPILVFILVAATLSGIIIWLLVSVFAVLIIVEIFNGDFWQIGPSSATTP